LITLDGVELAVATALVDSGADSSMFPAEWAARLGIDLYDKDICEEHKCATAGGTATSYVYKPGISARIEGHIYRLEASFSEHLSVILLGREFFMYYRITFDELAKCIILEPYRQRAWVDPGRHRRQHS
jgi:hypothetical protein